MTAFPKHSRFGVGAVCAGLLISISGCGDSTAPSKLDPNAALQSLALGMGSVVILTPYGPPIDGAASFDDVAPFLDQINVVIDGTSQTMFALGLRESFPAGTCIENVFINPNFPPLPGECTSPELGVGLILWQSHSASTPPDRLIFIVAEEGTSNFNFIGDFTSGSVPAVAIYLEGEENLWFSLSGTLTSHIAATSQSCGLPLPPYAKSGSCNIATFDEQGAITFQDFSETGPTTLRRSLTIPRQTIHGLWQTITETQPITVPAFPTMMRMR